MNEHNETSVTLLVAFTLQDDRNSKIHETTVSIPVSLHADEVVGAVKQRIRPFKAPDPSDNYRGQQPGEVLIINLVNLSKLL